MITTDLKDNIGMISINTQELQKSLQRIIKKVVVLKWMVGGILILKLTILAKLFVG